MPRKGNQRELRNRKAKQGPVDGRAFARAFEDQLHGLFHREALKQVIKARTALGHDLIGVRLYPHMPRSNYHTGSRGCHMQQAVHLAPSGSGVMQRCQQKQQPQHQIDNTLRDAERTRLKVVFLLNIQGKRDQTDTGDKA